MSRRDALLQALVVPPPGKYDLSGPAAAMTLQAYRLGQTLGRALPRPEEVFQAAAFGPFAPTAPFPIDRGDDTLEGGPTPRVWQYPVGWNLPTPPRSFEPVSFDILRTVAQVVDIVRKAIEIRKSEIASAEWDIVVKDERIAKDNKEYKLEEKAAIRRFFEHPDPIGGYDFDDWIRLCVEDVLVVDALSLYPRHSLGKASGPLESSLMALQVLDGSTIKPLVDTQGARPQPPTPAYQQFLWGIPRSEFAAVAEEPVASLTTEQLLYKPFFLRPHTVYGFPPVEQVITSAITYLRRELWWQARHTDGDIPGMFVFGGEGWTPQENEQYQAQIHSLLAGDPGWKWRIKVLPYGAKAQEIKEPVVDIALDEFLLKVIAMIFDVTPQQLGFSPSRGLGGKGFSEEMANVERDKGTKPMLKRFENLLTRVLQVYFKQPDLAFRFVGLEIEDAHIRAQIDDIYLKNGTRSINEVREEHGFDLLQMEAATEPMIYTGGGATPLSAIAAVSEGAPSSVQESADLQLLLHAQGNKAVNKSASPASKALDRVKELAAFERYAAKWL